MQREIFFRIISYFFLFLFFVNLIFLDWKIFFQKESDEEKTNQSEAPLIPTISLPSPITSRDNNKDKIIENSCPDACLQVINDATASIAQPVKEVRQPLLPVSTTKEVFIPLGTGSTKSTSWTDLTGIEAYIDTNHYAKIKEAYFEATLRIPTASGKVYARLYNVTDKHPVWFSEVSSEGEKGVLVRSEKIILDSGNKLYRIQMYSTIAEAFLDNARTRIVYE